MIDLDHIDGDRLEKAQNRTLSPVVKGKAMEHAFGFYLSEELGVPVVINQASVNNADFYITLKHHYSDEGMKVFLKSSKDLVDGVLQNFPQVANATKLVFQTDGCGADGDRADIVAITPDDFIGISLKHNSNEIASKRITPAKRYRNVTLDRKLFQESFTLVDNAWLHYPTQQMCFTKQEEGKYKDYDYWRGFDDFRGSLAEIEAKDLIRSLEQDEKYVIEQINQLKNGTRPDLIIAKNFGRGKDSEGHYKAYAQDISVDHRSVVSVDSVEVKNKGTVAIGITSDDGSKGVILNRFKNGDRLVLKNSSLKASGLKNSFEYRDERRSK